MSLPTELLVPELLRAVLLLTSAIAAIGLALILLAPVLLGVSGSTAVELTQPQGSELLFAGLLAKPHLLQLPALLLQPLPLQL